MIRKSRTLDIANVSPKSVAYPLGHNLLNKILSSTDKLFSDFSKKTTLFKIWCDRAVCCCIPVTLGIITARHTQAPAWKPFKGSLLFYFDLGKTKTNIYKLKIVLYVLIILSKTVYQSTYSSFRTQRSAIIQL